MFGFFIESFCQNEGLEIYLTNLDNPFNREYKSNECVCCLEPKPNNLIGEPILLDSDIESFNWSKQIIYLNESGLKKITEFDFMKPGRLPGVPAAITLFKIPIYGFMIYPYDSSYGCDRVFTRFNSKEIILRFGSGKKSTEGEWRYGLDPRFDKRIKHYLDNRSSNN
ncbi:hypothetical protein GCM10011344_09890 [Dokdonia pacifica]|nr:hypothetical protein GCM10011344_09890 [Dokdonia pacifica]